MRKRKVVEVEQTTEPVVQRKRPHVEIKEQALPTPRLEEGQKVRYTTVYGTVESKPYRILSRSLQYEWLNDMNYAYLYRIRRWDANVEEHGWANWATSTVWERQIEPWIEDIAAAQEKEVRNAVFLARVEEAAREVIAAASVCPQLEAQLEAHYAPGVCIPMPQLESEPEPEREVLNVDLEVSDYITGVTILNDAPDVYVTFTVTEEGEKPWLTLRLQSK